MRDKVALFSSHLVIDERKVQKNRARKHSNGPNPKPVFHAHFARIQEEIT
jgi:hypothetical protein